MDFTFLGTADSAQVPAYNCACLACARAQKKSAHRRGLCSALIKSGRTRLLIDAGLMDLAQRFDPADLQGILLTHYHADHVQGLLSLRWGVNTSIQVYGPDDPEGFADLYKHPGILDFSTKLHAFKSVQIGDFKITPLPLIHSKLCLGYLFEDNRGQRLAYLTDTVGLSVEVLHCLIQSHPQVVVMDCSFAPREQAHRNHNDLSIVLALQQVIAAPTMFLTHISHEFDHWLMQHEKSLPDSIQIARDNWGFTL